MRGIAAIVRGVKGNEGTVTSVKEGAVNGHVTIEDEWGHQDLRLHYQRVDREPGPQGRRQAVAIVKATDVMVAVED